MCTLLIQRCAHFLWYLLQQKDNPKAAEQGVRFEKGMTGKSLANDSLAILTGLQVIFTDIILLNFWFLKGYPWDKLRQGAVVNDVGGGWGHISTQLYKRYPHLNFILQDLPERTEHAQKVWPNECPQAIAENKIQFKSVDLFVAPPVPHCDIYYVSYVYIAFIASLLNWIWHPQLKNVVFVIIFINILCNSDLTHQSHHARQLCTRYALQHSQSNVTW